MNYHIYDVSSGRVLQVVNAPKCHFCIDDYRPLFSPPYQPQHIEIDVIESDSQHVNATVINGALEDENHADH